MFSGLVTFAVVVLLASNVWILREMERLRRRLDLYQREVAELDRKLTFVAGVRGWFGEPPRG